MASRFQYDWNYGDTSVGLSLEHNLYDLLGVALKDAITSGNISQRMLDEYAKEIGFNIGLDMEGYQMNLGINQPNAFGYKDDWRAGISIPFNI
tara:strand:+ start:2339 stop:2617 length:279 start_codon:yes stop_codon:yes gene_type:complete